MSTVAITVTAPGGSPVDITNDCVFERCTFESLMNGQPGTFDVYVRDPDRDMGFTTGSEIRLEVDGVGLFGGYITSVGMTSFAPAADTSDLDEYHLALWHLSGADYNIAFDKRVFRNTSDYLKAIRVNETVDGQILTSAIENYTDMDDFSTSGISDVATIPDITFVTIQQGWPVRKEFETLLPFAGAVYYINADKEIVWKAYDDAEKRWGFSDAPNHTPITDSPDEFQGATYGFSRVEGVEDASYMANDVFIWGGSEFAGSGGTVFARATDTDSIDDHGRWQYAETHFGETMFKSQNGVNAVSNAILNGPPGTDATGQQKGLKRPQWQFNFTWFSDQVPLLDGTPDHIRAGDLVTINLSVFDETRLLPVRSVRISFPNAFDGDPGEDYLVQFDGTFGLQLSDSFTLWRYVLKNNNRTVIQTPSIVGDSSTESPFGANYQGVPVPAPDGSATVFTIPFPYIPGTTQVYLNGILQRNGTDYVESNSAAGQITFTSAPLATDDITVAAYTTLAGSSSTIPPGSYYIATTGNDSTGDGSEGNPWATLSKFVTEAGPGATGVFEAGTYDGSLNRNISWASLNSSGGTAGNPITIRSRPGAVVLFDGEANGTSDDDRYFIIATGEISYVILDGLILRNYCMVQDGIITLSAQNPGEVIQQWQINNCDIQQVAPADPSSQGVYLGERFTGLFAFNTIFRGPYPSGLVNGGAAISAFADSGPAPTNVNADHCIFTGWYAAGVQFYSDGVTGSVTHGSFMGNRTNVELHGDHGAVLLQNNAYATAPNGSVIDDNPSETDDDNNFSSQTFTPTFFLQPGNTGIKHATDGTDAGALNS